MTALTTTAVEDVFFPGPVEPYITVAGCSPAHTPQGQSAIRGVLNLRVVMDCGCFPWTGQDYDGGALQLLLAMYDDDSAEGGAHLRQLAGGCCELSSQGCIQNR